jgi:hypothetical protein
MRAPTGRFRDQPTYLSAFADDVLVRCPRCRGRAHVLRESQRFSGRVVCDSCGFSRGPAEQTELWLGPVRAWAGRPCRRCGRGLRRAYSSQKHPPERRSVRLRCTGCGAESDAPLRLSPVPPGEAHDGLTGLPLWLQAPCRGHVLWALNPAHLAWLRDYVGAALRERTPRLNAALASRLPGWIKAARSRDDVLRCLDRMESTL